ncbi:uncharacterized protein LOC117978353 isoform X1 [Pan paniscus]|uniref:uncharacterized protein LOC117978353 isoform X1 n=1 Tax=Pan paniscus TaxID=9597 RepID=UPI0030057DE3
MRCEGLFSHGEVFLFQEGGGLFQLCFQCPLGVSKSNKKRINLCASTPETWTKFTQDNLCRAQRERLDSANLWVLVDCSLRDTSEDMGLQCDAVNLAFGRRCEELEDARHKLQNHLHKMGHPQPRRRLPLLPTTVPPLITWHGPSTPFSSVPLIPKDPRSKCHLSENLCKTW